MKKRILAAGGMALALFTACGSTAEKADTGTAVKEETIELKTYSWDEADVYEAEDGKLLGAARLSGDGVNNLANDGDGVELTISVAEDGFYDLNFRTKCDGNYKENYVEVDGQSLGTIKTENSEYADSILGRVYLTAGEHSARVSKFWGWIDIDKLLVKHSDDLDPAIYQPGYTLINPNATEETKRLYSYLVDNYGNHILSGQYCDTGMRGLDIQALSEATGGKYPAVLGLDFIEYSPSRVANGSVGHATDLAIDYWNNGGIVTFCWHWNAPEKYLTGVWYSGFYKEHTNIDLEKIMNGGDQEGYDLLMADIDAIAAELLKLQEAGVPVLWRPLHEAGGGWFWWGNAGAEPYKALYRLLYERLTNEYGLNNLIWIWNGQDKDWYPGDEYVDIIGEDLYPGERVYTPQTDKFFQAVDYTDACKMVVMSENGCLFDPELAARDGAWWGFFRTWNGEFVRTGSNIAQYSEQYTEKNVVQKVYDSELVITRDELPDLKSYPIGE